MGAGLRTAVIMASNIVGIPYAVLDLYSIPLLFSLYSASVLVMPVFFCKLLLFGCYISFLI
jgi:hypothetical protein